MLKGIEIIKDRLQRKRKQYIHQGEKIEQMKCTMQNTGEEIEQLEYSLRRWGMSRRRRWSLAGDRKSVV